MIGKHKHKHFFFGATTIGSKGQVVIPAEARKAMNIKKGDKLLVFGMGHDIVTLTKLSQVEQFASHLSGKLGMLRDVIKKTKSK